MKSTDEQPEGEPLQDPQEPQDEAAPSKSCALDYNTFLTPRLPGKFMKGNIKRKTMEWRKKRYLKAFRGSMGNHSIALYYSAWTPAEFREIVASDPDFEVAISDTKAEVSDRAAFILHKSMGLIAGSPDAPIDIAAQSGPVLARIVEKMNEKKAEEAPKRKTNRKLMVNGLKRPGDKVDLPPTPPPAA